jgi:hypothetical protein
VICHTTGVGVVLLNRQSRVVIEKPIEDVRRLARGRRDHLGIERPELVGDVGIERDAGLVAMACVLAKRGVFACSSFSCRNRAAARSIGSS